MKSRSPGAPLLLTLAVLLPIPPASGAQEVDPADRFVERPLVTGRTGIVTSLHPLASMAGMRILSEGGNAFDAAVATAVAVTVVDPKNSSIGGQGFATVYVAETDEVRALNFFGPAPRNASIEALEGEDYTVGYLATPVPSNLAGYRALLESHGTMSWAQVLAPATELAAEGFVVTEDVTDVLERRREALREFPTTVRAYYRADGSAPRPGEVLVQPDLARTLEAIAEEGAEVFYEGRIARHIADFYGENGGLLTLEDLAQYRATWVEPISTTYRGYTLYTQPPNSSAVALLLQLNLLEGYDLESLGHNSAEHLHRVGEVMRLAIADRNAFVGDPDHVTVPVEELLSKEYAEARRREIVPGRTMPSTAPGRIADGAGGREASAPRGGDDPADENTTHLTVVDREGNMVALTQTLGAWMGSGVVAGNTGVLFSNQMRHLHLDPDSPTRVEPGKRPRSNQSPTIVLRDGEPFMALGTPGGDAIWQRMAQVIVNIVDFGMDIQSAVTAPRMIYGGSLQSGTDLAPTFRVEDRVGPEVIGALRDKGFDVDVIANDGGRLNGVVRDPVSGMLLGGADPRSLTYAVGW